MKTAVKIVGATSALMSLTLLGGDAPPHVPEPVKPRCWPAETTNRLQALGDVIIALQNSARPDQRLDTAGMNVAAVRYDLGSRAVTLLVNTSTNRPDGTLNTGHVRQVGIWIDTPPANTDHISIYGPGNKLTSSDCGDAISIVDVNWNIQGYGGYVQGDELDIYPPITGDPKANCVGGGSLNQVEAIVNAAASGQEIPGITSPTDKC